MIILKTVLIIIVSFIFGWLYAMYYCSKKLIEYFMQEGRTKQVSLAKTNEILKLEKKEGEKLCK